MDNDNFLLVVAVVAVAVSLIATGFTYFSIANLVSQISGFATSTAQANLTVESTAAINFTTNFISWGSGRVNPGSSSASLTTLGTNNVTGGNWTLTTAGGLRVENIGTINVSLNITVGKNASNFIGGTNPAYELNITNAEASSCLVSTFTLGSWYTANTTNNILNCGTFQFISGADSIRIDINLTVPETSLTGALTDTITATASP